MPDGKPSAIMQYKELILALAALAAGLGGMLKPTDTTAVKTGHKWTEAQITMILQTQTRQHHDLQNMREFLENYVEDQIALEDELLAQEEAAQAAPRRRGRAQTPKRRKARRAPPQLPSLSAAPKGMKPVEFDQMLQMDESDLARMLEEAEAEAFEETVVEMEEELPPDINYDGPDAP